MDDGHVADLKAVNAGCFGQTEIQSPSVWGIGLDSGKEWERDKESKLKRKREL